MKREEENIKKEIVCRIIKDNIVCEIYWYWKNWIFYTTDTINKRFEDLDIKDRINFTTKTFLEEYRYSWRLLWLFFLIWIFVWLIVLQPALQK